MAKISSAGLRVPDRYEGINFNFCKNPKCANFGVPETPNRPKRNAGEENQPGDYILVAAGKGKPLLSCSCLCCPPSCCGGIAMQQAPKCRKGTMFQRP
jgi:hypothetical protein